VISVIILSPFAVPSILYTGIRFVRVCIGMLFNLAHSISIKQPVAPQSTRAWVHHFTTVSIASISTLMRRDIDPGLGAMMYSMGNQHSQAGMQLYQFGIWDGRVLYNLVTFSIVCNRFYWGIHL
jgi:hypothetical protein